MGTYLIGNVKGPKGEDGVSPSAKVQQLSNGAIITITDADGTTSARIRDGVDADGHNIDLTIYPTKVEVNGQIAGLANTYATKTELTNRINAIDIPVSSVNGMTGAVVIPETDLTGYATQSWINQQGFLTQAPVASVNGKTGNVSLSAYDVGALPDNTEIPTDTSDLTNSANFVDQSTLNTYLAAKQDALSAGAGIDITNNVVSAKQKLIVADATNFTQEERIKFDNQTPTNEIYDRATNTTYYFAGREGLVVGEKLYYSPLLDFVSNGVSKDTDVYYIQLSGSGSFTTSGLVAANASGGGFSGNYNDLTNKPDLSVYATNSALAAKQDILTAGTNITISNNVISATGGSNYGDADVAEYIEDTFGMAKTSVPSGTQTYSFNNIPLTTKTLLDTAAITMPPISPVRPLAMDQVEIWGSNGLLTSIAAQNWVSISGGGNPSQWEYVVSPENDSSVSLTIGASSDDGHKIYLKDFTCSYADAQSYSGAFDITVPAHTEVSTLQTQFIPIDNNTIRVNSSGKLEAQSSGGGTTYTAGTGIDITNDEISIDNTVALKSDIPADELPTITSGDAGKVLTVNNSETGVEWITPSGGGGSSGSSGIKVIDVSQGTSQSSFNSNAELLAIGQALADGDDIPIIAIRNGNNTGELWYLINTRRATGDGGLTYTVYCDWYGSLTNDIYHNRYMGSSSQWRDQSTQYTYGAFVKPPTTGASVGKVLAIKSVNYAGVPTYEWKNISGDSSTNPASALYLKDANNQVYKITVDTTGNLVATAV